MTKKITIKDIALLANVSKTTVSFYLNGNYEKMSIETKERIEKIINETGYKPNFIARSLNYKQSKLIGVIIGDITNTFANQILKGIDDCAKQHGYQLIFGNSNYDDKLESNYVVNMNSMGVDGFIIQPTVNFPKVVENLKLQNHNIVYIDSPNSHDRDLWVKTNNYEAVMEATETLVNKGYENFIMISANPDVLSTRLERNRGFVDTLELKDKEYHIILADEKTKPEDLEIEIFKYVNENKKTLIFACNNWLLSTVYISLRNHLNKIPADIGLIGFDSLEWSTLVTPSITTIVQPAYEEGFKACEILIDKIEDINEELPNQIFKCTINYGDSTL